MKKVDEFIKAEKLEETIHLILQIHDELIYEIEESLVAKIAPKIQDIMQGVLSTEQTLGVPIIVDTKVGNNWGELK